LSFDDGHPRQMPGVADLDIVTRIVDFGSLAPSDDGSVAGGNRRDPGLVFALADVGVRFVAWVYDFVIAAALMSVIVMFWMSLREEPFAALPTSRVLLFVGGLFALHILMSAAMEWLCAGQTPGQNVFGLRVVSTDGGRVGAWQALVRNLSRVIDFLPAFYICGVWATNRTAYRQRMGDSWGHTLVIADVPFRQMLAEAGLPPGVYSTSVTGSMVESLLARRDELAPEAATAIARKLALYLDAENPVTDDFNLKRLLREQRYMDYLDTRVAGERAGDTKPTS